MDKLDMRQETYTIFREPDLSNEITALASVGDGRALRKLRLMKFSDSSMVERQPLKLCGGGSSPSQRTNKIKEGE